MDWEWFTYARQYVVEKYVGRPLREAKAVEDAQAKAAAMALQERRR